MTTILIYDGQFRMKRPGVELPEKPILFYDAWLQSLTFDKYSVKVEDYSIPVVKKLLLWGGYTCTEEDTFPNGLYTVEVEMEVREVAVIVNQK